MEHEGATGAGAAEVITQTLVFLAATCVVIPALRRLRLSSVMGFLLIGVAMGPQVLGQLAQTWPWLGAYELEEAAPTTLLAEFGVIFLLFIIGLEVSFERLWALRRFVFGLGAAQIVLTTAAIAAIALTFGYSFKIAAVLGLAFALSSTALVLQLLRERGRIGASVGRASFSVLLLQDLMVVPVLFLVAALSEGPRAFGLGIGVALITGVVSLALILIVGRLLLRPLFRWVAAANSREIFVAAALLAAIGMAAAAQAAGLSMALGAFLAGLLLAETEFRYQIESDLEPFKDLLLGLFFVTVGMQIDVGLFLREPILILLGVAGLFLLKAAIIAPLARAFGLPWPRAVETALLLGQAGEFAFVVIAAAQRGGAIPETIAEYMLLVTALSLFVTPLMATLGERLAASMGGRAAATPPADAASETGHVVIAGFGRVGQMLSDLLAGQEVGYVALDSNSTLVSEQRKQGRPVYFGEASTRQALASVGAANAAAIVVTINDADSAEHIVSEARQAWPHVPVYARAHDAAHARRLHAAGAALASPETLEAALQLGEALLEGIGTPDETARRIIDTRRKSEVNKALHTSP